MTEVPEYLLQRSRERRAALGLGGGEAGAAPVPATTGGAEAAADSAPAVVPATTPVPARAPVPVPVPVKPDAPWVTAARKRKKVPVWMTPVLLFTPFWMLMWFGTLEEPTREATGPLAEGATVYDESCSSCHGGSGGGGSGPQLSNGEVVATFPGVEDHVAWVINGAPAEGTPYGAGDREGGQRVSTDNMPSFASLEPAEILDVVLHERVSYGQIPEAQLQAWVAWSESADMPEDWPEGTTAEDVKDAFDEFLAANPEIAEAQEEALAAAAEG